MSELRVTIKPRWNIWVMYILIKLHVPTRWLFTVSDPRVAEGL